MATLKRNKSARAITAIVGGARVVCRWAWSKAYRAEVAALMRELAKPMGSIPYRGDLPITQNAPMTAERLYIMRTALAILEGRGVDVSKASRVTIHALDRVEVHFGGTVSRRVNLAPVSKCWIPPILETLPGRVYHGWYVGTTKTRDEFERDYRFAA